MKKHFLVAAFVLFLSSLLFSIDAGAQGRGRGHNKHYYKEQRRADHAYRHGYYAGVRQARRYDRRHPHYVAYAPPPRRVYYRHHHGRRPYYAPRPYVRGGVTINVPLPPHPPLPPLPPHP